MAFIQKWKLKYAQLVAADRGQMTLESSGRRRI